MKFVFVILFISVIIFGDRHSKDVQNKYNFGFWVGAVSMALLGTIF